jgi:hypothetical protein
LELGEKKAEGRRRKEEGKEGGRQRAEGKEGNNFCINQHGIIFYFSYVK